MFFCISNDLALRGIIIFARSMKRATLECRKIGLFPIPGASSVVIFPTVVLIAQNNCWGVLKLSGLTPSLPLHAKRAGRNTIRPEQKEKREHQLGVFVFVGVAILNFRDSSNVNRRQLFNHFSFSKL